MRGGAVVSSVPRWLRLAALCSTIAIGVSGCSSLGAISGTAAALTSGFVTANPAVGVGIGIAVQAATDVAVNRFMKGMHADQQQHIAEVAGQLQAGEIGEWRVDHTLPVENGHGKVRMLRSFSSALASCREFAFSVQDGDEPTAPEQWYTAVACESAGQWQWANAEPAVTRWGALQ